MRLRRPRCRCPAGADAEAAAAEDAAREAGARTRAQHFFLCPAPGLWERARNNSTALSPPLAQAKTPFLSSLLPRSPSPRFSRSCFTAAQGSQTSAPALRALSGCSFLHEDPDKCPLAGADCCSQRQAPERAMAVSEEGGSHLSFSGCHRPTPQQLRRTRVLGLRFKRAPALAQAVRRVGSDWVALRDREQPPDAATAPLRALAPEASTRELSTP